ncbi:hypothetical protein D9757_001163 [Collybiopsis confluens]|uniref:Uncharacterized protein n=1 Tax=Collybiopsis confluens TaxID=2823264 RepID=A0A8H5I0W3_9AGAR|nr:hypothetical protein D9757_001163 [Collybiopsis confluens]
MEHEDQARLGGDIESCLDQIVSLRATDESKLAAFRRLELIVGGLCVKSSGQTATSDVGGLGELLRLQDQFEYNIPSRLLPWISLSSANLESLYVSIKIAKDGTEPSQNDALKGLATQIMLALSIIQGIALNHSRSKDWLGRIKSLEILVDLLLASRHVSSIPSSSSEPSKTSSSSFLPSTTLDTLLCILVDSTSALRAFEQCNGVQAIVKILKRAATPREVRMKCMEFLYFYLLDETKPSSTMISTSDFSQYDPSPVPTAPSTPMYPRTHSRSRSSLLPPPVPSTPAKTSSGSHTLLRGSSTSSLITSDSSSGSASQLSTAPRAKAKKPYLGGLAPPNRPSPKPRTEYGSSTYSFPSSSYSGPSVGSANASTKGYVTESSQTSRSNSHNEVPNSDIDSVGAGKGEGEGEGIGRSVGTAKSLRSASSGSAQSFTSTSSTTSAASFMSAQSATTTAPSSAESSPKKNPTPLPGLPTIPSGTMYYETPPGSPEMGGTDAGQANGREPTTPSVKRSSTAMLFRVPPRTPAPRNSSSSSSTSDLSRVFTPVPSSEKRANLVFSSSSSVPSASNVIGRSGSGNGGAQLRSLMMLKKEVDFVPESPQKIFGVDFTAGTTPSPMGVHTGTVAGMGGRRTRTHSRTRSALVLGASSTMRVGMSSGRGTSRERERGMGHMRAKSVGRSEREESMMMQEGRQVREALGLGPILFEERAESERRATAGTRTDSASMEVRPRTTEEKKEILGTMLGNVDALVEGVRNVGIWGLA